MLPRELVAGAISALVLTGTACADFVTVDDIGGSVVMHAGDLPALFQGGPTDFTNGDLDWVHLALNGSGVQTDGFVTFMLANTDAGLTFITLVDEPGAGGPDPLDSQLLMSTTAPDTLTRFVNADANDDVAWFAFDGIQTQQALWQWDGADEGQGFAWGNLHNGDFVSMFFTDQGTPALTGNAASQGRPFQFLSFNGEDWEQVAVRDFTAADQFAFTFTAVPAPGAIALFGMTLVSPRRRRR